ncbi:MAG: DUF993 family protein [Planctomycetota bacterium]|jgi:hypothetical protein|nr:DUF993 family protein [Planctomycetota bacterium]
MKIELPNPDGEPIWLEDGSLSSEPEPAAAAPVRVAYAAAHIILKDDATQRSNGAAGSSSADAIEMVDWDQTMAFRQHLASHGFGIAEAMDTAQRFELGWPAARRLIEQCGELDLETGFIAGAGADQCDEVVNTTMLVEAVVEQVRIIQQAGGIAIILPMPWLCRWNCDEQQYLEIYRSIIEQSEGPVLLHWLGPMFLAELAGYFPGDSLQRILDIDPDKVRGVKMSMLDHDLELEVRRRCSERDQIVLTGDDFHFCSLMEGAGTTPTRSVPLGDRQIPTGDFSHALLGVLDAVAVPAGRALRHLAVGDVEGYRRWMEPCEKYGQKVFEAPTHLYKAGLAFTSWLNGHQRQPLLLDRIDLDRDLDHLLDVARLASKAGAIVDAGVAAERIELMMAGVHR